MQIVWFIIAGICGGVVAGMGMGGGTLLIPILTIFLSVPQKLAQAINLIVFLPVSIISIIIYAKKGMINFKVWWIVSLPASIVSLAISFFVVTISSDLLKIIFASFLILLGVVQIVIFAYKKSKKGISDKNN